MSSSTTFWLPRAPGVAQFTPDGKKIWVSSEIGGTVAVVDTASRQVEREVHFEIPGINVDTSTADVIKYVLVGVRVWHLSLSADGTKLFTTNGGTNDVTVLDTRRLAAMKSIAVGRQLWGWRR